MALADESPILRESREIVPMVQLEKTMKIFQCLMSQYQRIPDEYRDEFVPTEEKRPSSLWRSRLFGYQFLYQTIQINDMMESQWEHGFCVGG